MPRAFARILLMWKGIWVEATTFSLPNASRYVNARNVSIMVWLSAFVWYVLSITRSQSFKTASTSPSDSLPLEQRFLLLSAPTGQRDFQSSSGCTSTGLSFAFLKSRTGLSTSYSVFINFNARSTACSVSPATMATTSPTKRSLRSIILLS